MTLFALLLLFEMELSTNSYHGFVRSSILISPIALRCSYLFQICFKEKYRIVSLPEHF
jgi:hypothetical protein